MTILLTGGTGLVGSRLARRLAEAGLDCRALLRPGKELPAGIMLVPGAIRDPDSLSRAVQGASAIVHLAAVFRDASMEPTWTVNLDAPAT